MAADHTAENAVVDGVGVGRFIGDVLNPAVAPALAIDLVDQLPTDGGEEIVPLGRSGAHPPGQGDVESGGGPLAAGATGDVAPLDVVHTGIGKQLDDAAQTLAVEDRLAALHAEDVLKRNPEGVLAAVDHEIGVFADHAPVGGAPLLQPMALGHQIQSEPVGIGKALLAHGRHGGGVNLDGEAQFAPIAADLDDDSVFARSGATGGRQMEPESCDGCGGFRGRADRFHTVEDAERSASGDVRVDVAVLFDKADRAGIGLDRDVDQTEPGRLRYSAPIAPDGETDSLADEHLLEENVNAGHTVAGNVDNGGMARFFADFGIGVEEFEAVSEFGAHGRGSLLAN